MSGIGEDSSAFEISDRHKMTALYFTSGGVVTAVVLLVAARKWRCVWLEHVKHALQEAGDSEMSGGSLDHSGPASIEQALAWLTMRTWLVLDIWFGTYKSVTMTSVFPELLLEARKTHLSRNRN